MTLTQRPTVSQARRSRASASYAAEYESQRLAIFKDDQSFSLITKFAATFFAITMSAAVLPNRRSQRCESCSSSSSFIAPVLLVLLRADMPFLGLG
jgi:hypothetical protein